jgi:tRNA(Glu) U13 pseudouridine synthase TruD
VRLADPRVEARGEDLHLAFGLPKGAFATVVVREVTKNRPLSEGLASHT